MKYLSYYFYSCLEQDPSQTLYLYMVSATWSYKSCEDVEQMLLGSWNSVRTAF